MSNQFACGGQHATNYLGFILQPNIPHNKLVTFGPGKRDKGWRQPYEEGKEWNWKKNCHSIRTLLTIQQQQQQDHTMSSHYFELWWWRQRMMLATKIADAQVEQTLLNFKLPFNKNLNFVKFQPTLSIPWVPVFTVKKGIYLSIFHSLCSLGTVTHSHSPSGVEPLGCMMKYKWKGIMSVHIWMLASSSKQRIVRDPFHSFPPKSYRMQFC